MSEAFVYLWYDSKNRMYYLGKHKGTPDDGYTHSSTIMESFKSDEVPSHMKRRILAYGTHEEMMVLENKLLVNRKAKKWDKYYNRHVGDPRVVDQWGENNPHYKHGLSHTKEYNLEKTRIWRQQNPEYNREYQKKYRMENLEKVLRLERERSRRHREKNPEKYREYHRKKKKEYYHKKKLEKQQGNSVSLDEFMQ